MAHINVTPIKSHACVSEQIRYAADLSKTRMPGFENWQAGMDPLLMPAYVSGIGVSAPRTADAEFRATHRRWGRPPGNVAYHFIQSFHPKDNADVELVHRLGRQLVRRACAGHEAVVATHLNRPHLHNHLIVNAVRVCDGKKLAPEPGHGLYSFRLVHYLTFRSDELCAENGLMTMNGRDCALTEHWSRRKQSRNTWKGLVDADIRSAALRAQTVPEMLELLRVIGYETCVENGKTCLRPPGGKHFWHLDTFYLPWELEAMVDGGAMRALVRTRADRRRRRRLHPRSQTPEAKRSLGDLEAAGLLWLAILGTRDRFRFPSVPVAAFVYAGRSLGVFRLLCKAGIRTFAQAEEAAKKADRWLRANPAELGGALRTAKLREERRQRQRLRAAARTALGWQERIRDAEGKEGSIRSRAREAYER